MGMGKAKGVGFNLGGKRKGVEMKRWTPRGEDVLMDTSSRAGVNRSSTGASESGNVDDARFGFGAGVGLSEFLFRLL